MIDTPKQLDPIGYGKACGPPLATALTEIFAWILLTFYKVDMPANIQLDIAMVMGTLLVVVVPHDIFNQLTNRS